MRSQKPREIAIRVLQHRGRGAEFVEQLLDSELAQASLSSQDRSLVHELVLGITRWETTLDWLIRQKSERPPDKPGLQVLLRLGLYQMFWLDRIPDHAAVNETVDLARQMGFEGQSGFINALLRNYAREKEATKQTLTDLKKTQPALGYSHPEWLVQRWIDRWGPESTTQLLEWDNTPAKSYARVNTLRTDPGKLLEKWREENVEYDFVRADWLDENLVFLLKSHPPLAKLESFQSGWFYLQDPSTLLAVRMLDPLAKDRILDLCAAPGGKTTFIAQKLGNQGEIVACDSSGERLRFVAENCKRLGVECVKTITDPAKVYGQYFDRVLVDAPCSNTGVMRRRSELRWRIHHDEIARLVKVQQDLLETAVRYLEPGGVLVYSTCSLEPEENKGVVSEFVKRHPDFRLCGERVLIPFLDKVDGAYVAKFSRM